MLRLLCKMGLFNKTSNVTIATEHVQHIFATLRYSIMLLMLQFSSSSVASHAFSALCVYSKFRHHPHTLGYLCAKYCFFCGLQCWASLGERLRSQSLNHSFSLFDALGTEACTLELTTFWMSTLSNNPFNTSNVTGRHRVPKRKLRAVYRAPSLQQMGWLPKAVIKMDVMSQAPSLKRTLYDATCFQRRVWYRMLSSCYLCIWSSGIILTP